MIENLIVTLKTDFRKSETHFEALFFYESCLLIVKSVYVKRKPDFVTETHISN